MQSESDSYLYCHFTFADVQREHVKHIASILLDSQEEIVSLSEKGKNVKLFYNVKHQYLHHIQMHHKLGEEPSCYYDYAGGADLADELEFKDNLAILLVNAAFISRLEEELECYRSPILRENNF